MSTPFIAMASWFWRQKLSYQKIESSFGTLFFTKSKVYTDLQSIELTNSLVQAGSGPDIHLLSVGIKISGRKEIFNLRNDLAKLTEQDAANLIKEMAKITGISTINASKSFHDIYERVFKNQFKLADVNVNNY